MSAHQFIGGAFKPVRLDAVRGEDWGDILDQLGFERSAVCRLGNLNYPHDFTICIYSRGNERTEQVEFKYLVTIFIGTGSVEDILCSDLPNLLQLLSVLTPIARLSLDSRKERLQEIYAVRTEGNTPLGPAMSPTST